MAQQAAKSRELVAVDRLRSALLAAVGHDLRTPLASIKAAVSSLRQDDVAWTATESAELLATIEESADRLNALVANLLDMSRLQAGALSVQSQPVAMGEAVHHALIGLPDCVVDVRQAEAFPTVTGDPGLLERVVANLIANAVRFTPGDRPVTVTALRDGNIAHLNVIDHGPGVPVEDRDRMFAPFQRLDDRGARGVGLGLAIARGFTEAMGGTLGEVRLTPTEWYLLEVLVRHPGKLVSQRQLLHEVWGPTYQSETNYLRVYIAQLRRKLEPDPAAPVHLITEPGMGYRFDP